jgi:hypothetical protein
MFPHARPINRPEVSIFIYLYINYNIILLIFQAVAAIYQIRKFLSLSLIFFRCQFAFFCRL